MKELALIATILLAATTAFAEETKPADITLTLSEPKLDQMLEQGRKTLTDETNPKLAVTKYLNPIIAHFDEEYAAGTNEVYCASDSKVTLLYLVTAASATVSGGEGLTPSLITAAGRTPNKAKGDTIVLSRTWAEAYFLKAYALIEMGETKAARETLKKAIYLSPYNTQYWAELGHTHQVEKNWDACLKIFRLAEKAATHSAAEDKNADLTRAWRGIGFSLIETGKLDEAAEQYEKCLKLNPNDKGAQGELNYIKGLLEKQK